MANSEESQKARFYERSQKVGDKVIRQFWEASGKRKELKDMSLLDQEISSILKETLPKLMSAPFQDRTTIKDAQLANAIKIVRIASRVPIYKERFEKAGIYDGQISSWEQFRCIPPIYKQDLVQVYPDGCLNPDKDRSNFLISHSTGSTGIPFDVNSDIEHGAMYAVQDIRQCTLQSGLNYGAEDVIVLHYTSPSWNELIDGKYLTHFISSLISPETAAEILAELRPNILSIYPTNLEALLPFVEKWRHEKLKLIITNSEQSTPTARQTWSKLIGVPVLDEYGSEEARVIAMELPCGHYHTCDDTVITEILDPETLEPQIPGKPGLVAVTSLVNTAMPFIRYIQGDLATEWTGSDPGCTVRWGIIEKIEGRLNDAFLTKTGRVVPSGTMLDVTYRMMIDNGVFLSHFELIQLEYDRFQLVTSPDQKQTDIETVRERLGQLLEVTMEYPVVINLSICQRSELPTKQQKTRPIKRALKLN